MKNLKVKIKLISGGKLPEYKRDGDVCLDCYANTDAIISKNKRGLIPLGFALELSEGWEAVLRPRSGNNKDGLDSCIGTIDTNYRGELMACMINNTDAEILKINKGDRICQLAIREVPKIEWEIVSELSETNRGANGFGSSGK